MVSKKSQMTCFTSEEISHLAQGLELRNCWNPKPAFRSTDCPPLPMSVEFGRETHFLFLNYLAGAVRFTISYSTNIFYKFEGNY